MVYIRHSLPITTGIVSNWGRWLGHHFKHRELRGSHPVFLTKTQMKSIHRADMTGKGVRIKMSHSQLRHNVRHAKGLFDSLKGLVKTGINAIAPKAKEALGNAVSRGVTKLTGNEAVGRYASNLSNSLFDKAHGALNSRLGGTVYNPNYYGVLRGGSFTR